MKISGKIKCKKCSSNIEWEYIVPQKLDNFKIEKINENKVQLLQFHKIDNYNYLCQLRCKHCDSLNEFLYYSECYL